MQLEYYYLVFGEDVESCPHELWESILKELCVVFSVYGFKKKANFAFHEMHVICVDNKKLSIYDSLSDNIKSKLRDKRLDLDTFNHFKVFTKVIMPVLIREEGLCIKDNTKDIFGCDDDNDDENN